MIGRVDARRFGGLVIGLAAAITGCVSTSAIGGLQVSNRAPSAAPVQAVPADAGQRMRIELRQAERARRVMALPASWDQANVTFNSPTALTAPSQIQIPYGSFLPSGPGYVFTGDRLSTPPLPVLRPATDYTVTADLETASPLTLEAYGVVPGAQTIDAGPNSFTVTLSPTGVQGAEIPVTVKPASQTSPAVAYDSAKDEWLVCWIDGGNVMARRFNNAGVAQGAADLVVCSSAKAVGPAVAYNATAAAYMVTWSDLRNGHGDVFFRTVTSSDVLGTETALDHDAFHLANETKPTIAAGSGANRYLICWEDDRNNASNGKDLYARRLDSLGTLSSEINVAISPGATDQTRPVAVYAGGADRFVVGFEDAGDLRYQRINALTGAILDGAMGGTITSAAGAQDQLSMAINELDGYLMMAWRDGRGAPTQIYYAIMDPTGGSFTQIDTALTSGPATASNPLAGFCTAHGDYVVLFADNRSSGQLDLFLQRVKRDGVTNYGEKPISSAVGDQRPGGMVYSATSDAFLAAWEDDRNTAANTDIYAQRLR